MVGRTADGGTSVIHYEVSPDGKMQLWIGDKLIDEREVPEQWEYDAEAARQRGDHEEVNRLLAEQIQKGERKIIAHFFGEEP